MSDDKDFAETVAKMRRHYEACKSDAKFKDSPFYKCLGSIWWWDTDAIAEGHSILARAYFATLDVIKDVHSQRADDLCWMDIDKIFVAAGLPVPDRSVGDKAAMLKNCERFIGTMCQVGKWKSYVELEEEIDSLNSEARTCDHDYAKNLNWQKDRIAALEAERDKLQAFKDYVHAFLDAKGVPPHPPGVHGAEGCRIGDRMDWVFERFVDRDTLT